MVMKERCICFDEISSLIKIPYVGKNDVVNGLNLCNRETRYSSIISYVTSETYLEFVKKHGRIKALFITKALYEKFKDKTDDEMTFFITVNPEIEFYKLHEKLCLSTCFYNKYSFSSQVGKWCNIHPSSIIEDGVVLGEHVTIGPLSVIRRGSTLEDNVRVGCCSIIGSEGFQAINFENNVPQIITHVGGTRICRNVSVGDNTTVGNALFEGETIVGENTKIDNHVYIAHNCVIGRNNIITASALLMGSSILENNTWLAPNVVVMNKRVIHNNGFVGSMSLVTKDVPENTTVVGIPAKEWVIRGNMK